MILLPSSKETYTIIVQKEGKCNAKVSIASFVRVDTIEKGENPFCPNVKRIRNWNIYLFVQESI